ncbi:dicarboxylate/amino acid:cation symporter [Sphingoaurantiacus capsulatus]|uniref:Dicarboxylate/amino acid:cation symporter n=1 Tax=Sphingoaurantiacus capsulatus TaxID=1771310 RepID=A0ABV7XBH6_9SPHN
MSRWFATPLWQRILLAILLGAAAGWALGERAEHIRWIGDLFIRLIRMLVVPLVLAMIVTGVAALGDPKRLGTMGGRTIGLLIAMTALAVCVGLALGTWLQPGAGVQLTATVAAEGAPPRSIGDQLLAIVPVNPFAAIASGEMLAIIFFAMSLGLGALLVGAKAKPLVTFAEGAAAVMLRLVALFMELAPLGVFALIAATVGNHGLAVFATLFWLAAALILGTLFQIFVVQAALVGLVARYPLGRYFKGIVEAVLMAFSTTSSAATLPTSMKVAEEKLRLGKPIASAAIPLGVGLARDGTAVYVGLLSMFAAQIYGVALAPSDYAVLVLAATLLALGAAGVPSAALFMLTGVMSMIGVDDLRTAAIVAFILPFDRLLDMVRTVPNVTANLAVATAVSRWEGELESEKP